MNDGGLLSYNKDFPRKGLVFNTHGFSLVEVKILSNNLNNAYGLETWIKTNKNKPIIAVSGKKYEQIKSLIFPHIIESMRYKLPVTRK
jgi:LAGLIDADG DNA endonuclease family